MDTFLLTPKLQLPPPPHPGVYRARLVGALERGTPGYTLTLLAAPAGYAKTTLLSQLAHATQFPVVWFSIGDEDNDIERFFRYWLAGWQGVQADIGSSPVGLLLRSMSPDSEAMLSAFRPAERDAYRHYCAALRHAFPELHFTIEDQVAESDRVVTRWTARRIFEGEFQNIPPSGKHGAITGIPSIALPTATSWSAGRMQTIWG